MATGKRMSPEEARRALITIVRNLERHTKKSAEYTDALAAVIGNADEGLVAAIADLRDEVRGLREDIRAVAQADGLNVILKALRGG